MISEMKRNSQKIINYGLLLFIVINVIYFIVMKSLGSLIVLKLRAEKIYTIIVILLLSTVLLSIIIELVFKKLTGKLFLKILFFLIITIVYAVLLWSSLNRTTVTLKNNSGMELTDITILAPFEKAIIPSMDVNETLTIPANLNDEGGILGIRGKLGSDKTFSSETRLGEGLLYIKGDMNLSIDASGKVEYQMR